MPRGNVSTLYEKSSLLAYAKKGYLETEESDNPSSDSDLDNLYLDDPPTDPFAEQETSSATVESSEAQSE